MKLWWVFGVVGLTAGLLAQAKVKPPEDRFLDATETILLQDPTVRKFGLQHLPNRYDPEGLKKAKPFVREAAASFDELSAKFWNSVVSFGRFGDSGPKRIRAQQDYGQIPHSGLPGIEKAWEEFKTKTAPSRLADFYKSKENSRTETMKIGKHTAIVQHRRIFSTSVTCQACHVEAAEGNRAIGVVTLVRVAKP